MWREWIIVWGLRAGIVLALGGSLCAAAGLLLHSIALIGVWAICWTGVFVLNGALGCLDR